MNGFRALEDRLQAIKGTVISHALLESCVLFAICALVWGTGNVLLALFIDSPQVLGWVVGTGFLGLGAAAFYTRYWRTRRQLGTLERVALSLESGLGHDHNEIITALEWGKQEASAIDAQ